MKCPGSLTLIKEIRADAQGVQCPSCPEWVGFIVKNGMFYVQEHGHIHEWSALKPIPPDGDMGRECSGCLEYQPEYELG